MKETYLRHETYESEIIMKVRTFYTMLIIGVMFLSGVALSQQQTITYENFPKAKMMLIGLPLNFTDDDPGAVLVPVFGEQIRSGDVYWRFSRWNIANQTYLRYGEEEYTWDHAAQAYTAEKSEQGNPHDIAPGYGYWLAQSSANDVDDFSLTGTPADQEAPIYVLVDPPLTVQGNDYPGITMVSNPFLYPIDWKNAYYRINGTTEVTLEQAVNMGLVSQYAYPYDGDQYTPFNMTDGGHLNVWDGYWVEQLNPVETEYIVYDVACSIEGSGSGGDDCGTCPDDDAGQMKYLKLQYNGTLAKWIKVKDNKNYLLFWGEVQPGAEFEFYGVQWKQSMGPKINMYLCGGGCCCCNCDFDCEIHTSCSVPIGPGQVWGSFTIIEAISKNDVVMCPIGDTNKPVIKFYDADANGSDADLGDGGAIETDRFVITLTDADNDETYFKTVTVNDDSSTWIALTEEGTAVSDEQGFTVTLVSEDEGEYTFDVASTGSQTAALESVKFRFGDDQTISSPSHGGTYSSTRTLLGGVEVTSLELKTPPIDVSGQLAKASDKPVYPVTAESVSEWIIPISVSSEDGQLIDNYNGLGVKEAASDMYDPLDARNFTPNLDTYVDIYFPHHEENDRLNYWSQKPMKASYDIRSDAEAITWDFRMVYYYAPEQQFTISWDASQFPSADKELVLINEQTEERIDMLAVSEYTVTTPSDEYGILYFAVAAFNKEEASAVETDDLTTPSNFRLFANYPNPFNASTRIYYSLPQAADVKLNIYSLNGKLVNTLVNNHQVSGYYGYNWDGTDHLGNQVSSGVYIYCLQADNRVESRKMVLMK